MTIRVPTVDVVTGWSDLDEEMRIHATVMPSLGIGLSMLAGALVAGCASTQPPPPPPESPPTTAAPTADDPGRRLTKTECESLAQSILDACGNRGNDRSTEADGWCSDMVRNNAADRSWVGNDCLPHFKYMDYFCFTSTNAHGMMVCDRTVDRSH